VVRYVTHASERFEMRNRIYQSVIDLLHGPEAESRATVSDGVKS
jgi:hypothetical protein